jgi:coniferyl-aldehyde dehydrogenase
MNHTTDARVIELQEALAVQQAAYLAAPCPSARQRQEDLRQLARMLTEHKQALVEAIAQDYGSRSSFETLFAEFLVVIQSIGHARKHVARWMKPQRRPIDIVLYPGAGNRLIPQPLGVVGVIVPWNFPLNLSMCPLASIFAAGNRAMVKMSENSRHLAELLQNISPSYFAADKLQFFVDRGGLGPVFSGLPFDHLLFTGSSATGRAVMANAARNLTPVTLELGGKSPAIVGPDYPVRTAAERILWAKLFNAGQICTSVDYVFLPEGAVDEFVAHCKELVAQRYPDLASEDYTAIIDERSFERLQHMLNDALARGATLVNLAPGQAPDAAARKFPPHLVLNMTEGMALSQREIFGPILPIRTYRSKEDVARYINAHERPLALYPFTHDRGLQDYYIRHVMSGGVAINDTILHVAQDELPFGGVGASGMGHYHGREGFQTFSKLRPVFRQGPFSSVQAFFMPPYSGRKRQILDLLLRLKG